MQFTGYFSGGSKDGMTATLGCKTFRIGMRITMEDEVYELQDGPAARICQETQEQPASLCCRFVLVTDDALLVD